MTVEPIDPCESRFVLYAWEIVLECWAAVGLAVDDSSLSKAGMHCVECREELHVGAYGDGAVVLALYLCGAHDVAFVATGLGELAILAVLQIDPFTTVTSWNDIDLVSWVHQAGRAGDIDIVCLYPEEFSSDTTQIAEVLFRT